MRQCCGSPEHCLADARWPCDTLRHVGPAARRQSGEVWDRRVARRISSVSFLLSCDSAFRREARTALAMASPNFDPTATGPSGLRDRQPCRAADQRVHRPGPDESAHELRRRPRHGGRPGPAHQGRAQPRSRRPRRSRARPPPGLPGHDARRSHRPNRRDHRTPRDRLPRQPHRPRPRDRERRARPDSRHNRDCSRFACAMRKPRLVGRRRIALRCGRLSSATRSTPRRKQQRFGRAR